MNGVPPTCLKREKDCLTKPHSHWRYTWMSRGAERNRKGELVKLPRRTNGQRDPQNGNSDMLWRENEHPSASTPSQSQTHRHPSTSISIQAQASWKLLMACSRPVPPSVVTSWERRGMGGGGSPGRFNPDLFQNTYSCKSQSC